MGFSTEECAWKQVSVTALGRKFVGIDGFTADIEEEADYMYGAGSEPIDIQDGNCKYPGTLKLKKYEVDMLNDAALLAGYENIIKVPYPLITITVVYKKTLTSKTRTIVSTGVKFTKLPGSLEQNDKFSKVELPYLAMKTAHV